MIFIAYQYKTENIVFYFTSSFTDFKDIDVFISQFSCGWHFLRHLETHKFISAGVWKNPQKIKRLILSFFLFQNLKQNYLVLNWNAWDWNMASKDNSGIYLSGSVELRTNLFSQFTNFAKKYQETNEILKKLLKIKREYAWKRTPSPRLDKVPSRFRLQLG